MKGRWSQVKWKFLRSGAEFALLNYKRHKEVENKPSVHKRKEETQKQKNLYEDTLGTEGNRVPRMSYNPEAEEQPRQYGKRNSSEGRRDQRA
jgi:hypothetical protein